ncbi:glycosyltransferase family 2 protein [Flavobacterium ajazii]|uniref:glycosyltransferase family 2 protein n=1 Tax=Flavobacterium ajazii TaxID=2692318 RepID=UPI0013D82EE7|nr:glycosyltransferase family 2 protein [Flavobacterium ajazii]
MSKKFSILITTKNRIQDLRFTLHKIKDLIKKGAVECIICDDGSTDGTSNFIRENYSQIHLIRNEKSKGLIYSRNRLLDLVSTEFAITIDDDLHFITQNPLESIEQAFRRNPKIGLLGFRIYWNTNEPEKTKTFEVSHRMKSFVGCGHVWRMQAWRDIPDYPAWFIFYGEEDFASFQLFKKEWEIHYLPEVLVNHRVDIKSRTKNKDYGIRLRRSLRSGWYLYFLFYPLKDIPRRFTYSVWMQFKLKVFRGDLKALKAILLAMLDVVFSIPKIIQNTNRLSIKEYNVYQKLEGTKIYWQPEDELQ